MATIVEYVEGIEASKLAIKNAIVAKGVTVADTDKLNTYASKIAAIEGGGTTTPSDDGWIRPSDRPAVPTVNENEIYMLFGVQPTGPNDYAITLTATGGYTVDWGDGTVETIASATKCEHMYNYASLTITPNANGIKWIWIKFTPVANIFTAINTNVRHSLRYSASSSNIYVPQIYEIYINAPNIGGWSGWSTSAYTRYYLLEILNWQGTNKLTIMDNFFTYCSSLRKVVIDTEKVTSFDNILSNAYSANFPWNLNTMSGKSFSNIMQACYAYSFPIILNCSNAPASISFGSSQYTLPELRLVNMTSSTTTVNISHSSLTAIALENLFNDLYDRSATTKGTLTITGVFGANKLTKAQLAIATAKNWTVTGASTID